MFFNRIYRNSAKPAFTILVAIGALISCYAAPSQNDSVVREIKIQQLGENKIDETFIRAHVSSAVGSAINANIIANDVRKLLDSKRFSYIGTQIDEIDNGYVITYVVEGRLRISGKPSFNGNKNIPRDKALETIELKTGDYIDKQLADSAAEKLRNEYVRRKYYDAVVTANLTPIKDFPEGLNLSFDVKEGEKNKVRMISFNGNRAIKSRNLRRYSGQSPWWNPSGWVTKKRVSDYDLEILRSDARRQYLDIGYLDVEVSQPNKSRDENAWHVKYTVNEGMQYRVGEIGFEGVTLFSESKLLSIIPLKSGNIAGLSAIDDAKTAVSEFYSSRGYVDTIVNYAVVPDESNLGTIHVFLRVNESDRSKIRNIIIQGNTVTKDKVIRREIPLNPGDIYDEVSAERSRRKLMNLGYFSNVRYRDIQVEKGIRDLIYELDEQSTGTFMVGVGISSIDNLIGFLEITQSNFDISNPSGFFRGGGQRARLGLQASSSSTDLSLSFVEPWFLDRQLSLEVDAFIKNRYYNEYDQRIIGSSIGLSRHVPWVGRMSLFYTFQHVKLSGFDMQEYYLLDSPDTTYRYSDEDPGFYLGSLRLGWLYDTRNYVLVPTRGTRTSLNATLYSSVFGSDHDFYELDFRWRNYQELMYSHVLSFNVRASVVDSLGNDDYVPVINRYFLGGGQFLRGFKHRAIGPKLIPTGAEPSSGNYKPLGGQTMAYGTIEYTIPIIKYLRLAAFYDIGNVWEDAYDFDLSRLASTVGGGIRLDFPSIPLRLDYAHALDKDDDLTRKRAFVVWMGFDY